MSSRTSTTFQVFDIPPEQHRLVSSNKEFSKSKTELIRNLRAYRKNDCTELLQSTQLPARAFGSENGFVRAVVECYNCHHNLIIRPDDVWAAIMTQFSFYVGKNAEQFRSKFVDFEGKKELIIEIPGSLRTAPYDLFVKLMSKEIDENLVDPQVKSWILPNFSTTTENDLVSIGVIFMATMKKYFDYTCVTKCGIPSITLEGTTEDWISISGRLEKLKEYHLEGWYDILKPVLRQFVDAKKGKVNLDFWQKICHYQSGSGPSYVSGWITVFCVFDEDGNWQWKELPGSAIVNPEELDDENYSIVKLDRWPKIKYRGMPTGIVEVDVKINDNGSIYKSVMLAGHLATELMEDGCTLKPTLGWAIALKSDDESDEAPIQDWHHL